LYAGQPLHEASYHRLVASTQLSAWEAAQADQSYLNGHHEWLSAGIFISRSRYNESDLLCSGSATDVDQSQATDETSNRLAMLSAVTRCLWLAVLLPLSAVQMTHFCCGIVAHAVHSPEITQPCTGTIPLLDLSDVLVDLIVSSCEQCRQRERRAGVHQPRNAGNSPRRLASLKYFDPTPSEGDTMMRCISSSFRANGSSFSRARITGILTPNDKKPEAGGGTLTGALAQV
jgi:hypothetical protein